MSRAIIVALALFVFGSLDRLALADLLVRGYDTNLHDRFANSSDFIGANYDWSGVARSSSGRWATMVSPNYFISATHFSPGVGDTLTIYGSNNVAGPSQVVNVVAGQQIAGSDVWLGRIDTPTNFGTFAVASAMSPTAFINQEIYLFGVAGGFANPAQQRLGRNHIDAFLDDFSHPALGATVSDVIIYDYDTPTGGVGNDEALVFGGDSGAPSFIIVNGQPVLVGVHWFKYSETDFDQPREGTGDSLVSSYINNINLGMVGQQLTLVAVPEPSSWLLVGGALVFLKYQSKRRRTSKTVCSH
ncbi:MAG: hypothetical protein IT423_15095 [Pirellulaceae bacterium]|nr:hypothetical protein [Pirellulaceae bacterium]